VIVAYEFNNCRSFLHKFYLNIPPINSHYGDIFHSVSAECRQMRMGKWRPCLRGLPQTDAAGISVQAIGVVEWRRRQDQDIKRIY